MKLNMLNYIKEGGFLVSDSGVALTLYFMGVIDSIKSVLFVVFWLSLLVVGVYFLDKYFDDSDECFEGFKDKDDILGRFIKPCSIVAIIAGLIISFVPDKNNLLFITGAHYGVKRINKLNEKEEINKFKNCMKTKQYKEED